MMNRHIGYLLLVVIGCFSSNGDVIAAEPDCGSDVECVCTSEKLPVSVNFPDVRTHVLSIRKMLCIDNAPRVELYRAFHNFVKSTNNSWFDNYGGFQDDTDPLNRVLEIIEETASNDGFTVATVSLVSGGIIEVNGKFFEPRDESRCPQENCRPILKEFTDLYNYAQVTLSSAGAVGVLIRLSSLGAQWDSYLERTRSQTPLELFINSWNFQRQQTSDFAPPPKWQFIALHPGLVIENVADAVDGDTTKEALMVELLGANRWPADKWYQPTGASVVALYSDRVDIDDVRYGVAVHFNSTYTIGYTERDGDSGFFISLDLLKPFQNNLKTYSKFLE